MNHFVTFLRREHMKTEGATLKFPIFWRFCCQYVAINKLLWSKLYFLEFECNGIWVSWNEWEKKATSLENEFGIDFFKPRADIFLDYFVWQIQGKFLKFVFTFFRTTVWPVQIWIKVIKSRLLPPQHQSTVLYTQEAQNLHQLKSPPLYK